MNANSLKIRIALNITPIINKTLTGDENSNDTKGFKNLMKFKEALQHLLFNWEERNAMKFNFTTRVEFVNVQFPPDPITTTTQPPATTQSPETTQSPATTPSSGSKLFSNHNQMIALFFISVMLFFR